MPLLLLAATLATPPLLQAQTAIFTDTFGSSTLNGTSTPGGTATASSTSYDIASTKADTTGPTIGAGKLRLSLNSGTTAGYMECQALFASTPVQLVNVGDSINLTFTFTNTSGTLLAGGNGSFINAGLYNSGGSAPLAGSLNSSGLNGTAGSANQVGGCTNWQGYVVNVNTNSFTSKFFTRPVQFGGTTSANQDLLYSGAGTGLFASPGGTQIGPNFTASPVLTSGATYTMSYNLTLTAAGTITLVNNIYTGGDTSGTLLSSWTTNTGAANTYTNYSNSFDGFAIGVANKGTSLNPLMDISRIAITKNVYAAPVISSLTNRTVVAGNTITLAPTMTGNPPPAYQWQTNGVNITGATSAALTLNNVQYAQDGYVYSLIATNLVGAITNSMTLSVIVTPSITGLNNQSANVGDTVSISPTVAGVPTPSYQWRFGGVNLTDGLDGNGSTISGSTTASLGIANAQVLDSGSYSLVASNSAGIVTNSMSLTVAAGSQPPVITGPTNITVIQGNTGTFSASATGVPVPTLQWLDQTGTPITGATNSTLVLSNVQYSQNGFVYSIVASNVAGSATNGATLTVYVPPAISVQPMSLVVTSTQSATFSVTASGVPAPAYQWYFGTNAIGGATSSSYNIASAAAANIGNYFVTITNAAGAVTSSVASLLVNSTMSTVTLSPGNGAMGICYDTPLAVTFSTTPSLGTAGTIKIYNVTNSATPVDSISVTNGAQARTFPGDGQAFAYQTIQISGNTAKIFPHFGVMSSNATYYVTIDNGAFTDASGAYFVGITATNIWQFATKVGGPLDATNPIVNADGSADFVTVQGAVNSLATGTNATQRVVSIRNGLYNEIVDIAGKNNITLRGQSRTSAVIFFPNNINYQNPVNGGTTHARMTFKVNANDIVFDTMTISNSTPQGGGQAEALMIETSAKRCVGYNSEIDSRQDTILANVNSSQAYFYKSTIKGNFDYIWGGGNLYFDQCDIHTISGTGSGQLTAARTDTSSTPSTNFPWANPGGTYTANGMSFVNCTFTSDPGLGNTTLAGSNGGAGNNVSWFGCDFATNYVAPSAALFSGNYLFWQNSNTMTNSPVTFAVLTTIGVTNNDPRLLAATNVTIWFYGWTPQLSPNITSQPGNQTASAGQSASFTVGATGIPDPTYQWQHAGTNLPMATSATFAIASAQRSDGGNYAVVVSNGSGSVTSSVVTLTYSNTAPVAGANFSMGALIGIPSTVQIVGGKYPPTDADNDALTVTAITGATNGTVSTAGTNATYTATNGTTDSFTYTVSDGFGGTASATVTVQISSNVQGYNLLSASSLGNGTNVLTFAGIPTYNYALDLATNLAPPIHWMPQVTNPAANNGSLIYTNVSTSPQSYYRTRYVP